MQEETRRLFEELEEAALTQDVERTFALCTDDIVVEDVPLGRTLNGKEELRAYMEEICSAFSDALLTRHACLVCGNHVVVEAINTMMHSGEFLGYPATGREVEVRACGILRFQAGKLHDVRLYYDMASLLRQIGIVEELKAA